MCPVVVISGARSIVNVTGSNSINVFLGLGLPWTIGAVYRAVTGRTADWERRYLGTEHFHVNFEGAAFVVESGDIVFVTWCFCLACVVALLLVHNV